VEEEMRSFRSILVLAPLLAIACSSSESPTKAPDKGGPTVTVPTITGDVAVEKFCDYFKQIQCAANLGCCSKAGLKSDSLEKCIAATDCPAMIVGGAVTSGAVKYDAKLAGDYLRGTAASASKCEVAKLDASYAVGTRKDGEDCTPTGTDASNTLACAPGFSCSIAKDETTGVAKGTCAATGTAATVARQADGAVCDESDACTSGRCAEGKCAARLADGAACKATEDCVSGQCTAASGEACDSETGACTCVAQRDTYCHAPIPAPPSNLDWSNPNYLCVGATDTSGGGSDGEFKLGWEYKDVRYGCSIPGGIPRGTERCCVAVRISGVIGTSDEQHMYIKTTSGDGMKMTYVRVKKGTDVYEIKKFDSPSATGDCDGCFFGQDCNDCWVDADGHGPCKNWWINFKTESTICANATWL
jgi:hypothetical protein